MAKYVLDTHVLIWFLSNSQELSHEQKKAFLDPKSEFYVLTDVLEEIRRKFEEFKRGAIERGAIKLPPIVIWRILKKCKNVKIRKLSDVEVNNWLKKKPELRKIKKDDIPLVVKQLILRKKHPIVEVRIVTKDDNIKRSLLTKTI